MSEQTRRKIRSEAVWAEVRKAWEGGETARSVARRYDVGVPALWKRREAELWKRPEPGAGPVEPAEGWDQFAARALDTFEDRRDAARDLARVMAGMMQGKPLEEAPMWHLAFLYAWRAEHLGAETAALDRARAMERDQPWVEAFWDAEGVLRPLRELDRAMVRLYRDEWRRQVGLPEGAAEDWP